MFHLHNTDECKSEWNINESHIIIPMIEGDVTNKESDKIFTNAITLNSLEGADQMILTNALEHSFVIGFDKNLFETPSYANDLIIIQNSDLKLLSCNADLKNPIAYTVSYVHQDNNEILWQSAVPKDRNDKAPKEAKDVSNNGDSVHDLGKTEEQINLGCLDPDVSSQTFKTNNEIFIEKSVSDEKNEKKFQLIGCIAAMQNNEKAFPMQHLDTSKSIENAQSKEKSLENKSYSGTCVEDSSYNLEKTTQGNIFNVTQPVVKCNESLIVNVAENINCKTDKKEKVINKNKDIEDEKIKGEMADNGVSNSLREKSLPLKKKAKMKRTLMFCSDTQKSFLKQDEVVFDQHPSIKFPASKTIEQSLTVADFPEKGSQHGSDSDEPLINKVTKLKKTAKFKGGPRKFKKCILRSLVQKGETESKNKLADSLFQRDESSKAGFCDFNIKKFTDIYDLVECLRKCRLISSPVWQTLNSGLKEMKMDVLKEMNAKKDENCPSKSTDFSPQLKAFALVLYFKQPAAFNHLSRIYKAGWPSLNVIKNWKRQMNSHHKPRFVRRERVLKV